MSARQKPMPTDTDYECKIIRVTAPDTVMVRLTVPPLMGNTTLYVRLLGIECHDGAREHIKDWVELHHGSIELLVLDWLRDPYGRVLGDLSNGEEGVTQYLTRIGAADPYPDHHTEVMAALLASEEPEE